MLQSQGLLDDQVRAELAKGDMYWAHERELCAAMLARGGAPGRRQSLGHTTLLTPLATHNQQPNADPAVMSNSLHGGGRSSDHGRQQGTAPEVNMQAAHQSSTNSGQPSAEGMQPTGSLPSHQPAVQQHQITLDKVLQTHSAKSFDYRVRR